MSNSYYNVQKTFVRGVQVRDIAEPLPSFDATTLAAEARAVLETTGGFVVGVRTNGFVTACAELEALVGGTCGDCAQPLDPARILPDTATLAELVYSLDRAPFVFVRMLGAIAGVVTRADLEDPPVRMWLFGLLSTIEARFVSLIEKHFGDGEAAGWAASISTARLEKAVELQAERQRRQLNAKLLNCLQFSDKAQIVARNEDLRATVGFASRKRAEQRIKEVERLRNNLAHGQEIVASDWAAIVTLAQILERVAPRPAGPTDASDAAPEADPEADARAEK